MAYKARLKTLENLLKEDPIPLDALHEIAGQGIPDEGHLRPICWRILLGYLPAKQKDWEQILEKKRENYDQLVTDLIVQPGISQQEKDDASADSPQPNEEIIEDHPLSLSPKSEWTAFFKDNEVLSQIDKDCRRLCPEISFFQRATEYPRKYVVDSIISSLSDRVAQNLLSSHVLKTDRLSGTTNLVQSRKVANDEYNSLRLEQTEAHWEVVQRILFIYAKLNTGVKYVQGMNEILGPIYHVMACDPESEWRCHAEADAFFCFQTLMSEIKDHFIKTLDSSNCGIEFTMKCLYEMLNDRDPVLYDCLTLERNLLPQFFAFRWISLLLSQEFLLPDVIRLWDTLFSDPNRFSFLQYICCAMLISVRDDILEGDFGSNMKLLQNFPQSDIGALVKLAKELLADPEFRVSERRSEGRGARIRAENTKFWKSVTTRVTNRLNSSRSTS